MASTLSRPNTERSALVLAGFVAGALVAGLVVPFAFGTTGSREGSAAPAGAGTATQGLSRSQILVGVPVFNTQAAGATVAAGSGNDRELARFNDQEAFQAFIDEANKSRHHGRVIKPTYVSYNLLDPADAIHACNVLTEDRKVFAVLAFSFFGDAAPCVSVQHKTILLNVSGQPEEDFRQSEGRLFTQFFSLERNLRIWATDLNRIGVLRGKTIGILTSETGNNNVLVQRALVPTLKQLGYDIAHVATLSSDFGVAGSQMPLEVTQMRRAGVNAVFLADNQLSVTRFAQEADRQGYHPKYVASDFVGADGEFLAASYPKSFQDSIALTFQRLGEQRTRKPESAHDARCYRTYTRATGKHFRRGSATYSEIVQICSLVLDMFVPGVENAGRALSSASFSGGMQAIGQFDLGFSTTGSFGPGKYDAADSIRTVKFRNNCKCWVPTDDFRAAPR